MSANNRFTLGVASHTHAHRCTHTHGRIPANADLLVMVDATGTASDVSARVLDAEGVMEMAANNQAYDNPESNADRPRWLTLR